MVRRWWELNCKQIRIMNPLCEKLNDQNINYTELNKDDTLFGYLV